MALDFVVDIFVGSDGAKYYGTLRNGVPSGVGTCIWPNNCHYDGEWRNGVMHGFGTYVWANGQRYDGEWKDGRRAGIGIKTYVDGSMYDGFWRNGKKHGLGVFRPALDESNSRRHSNSHGWQPAQATHGQQQAGPGPGGLSHQAAVADSSPDLQALEQLHAQDEHPVSPAVADHGVAAVAAEAPVDSPPPKPRLKQSLSATAEHCSCDQQLAEQRTPKQRAQSTVPASPFEAAAAALNSENSVVLPATSLTKGLSWKPTLTSIASSSTGTASAGASRAEAAAEAQAAQQHSSVLATVAADADASSSTSPATTAGPAGTTGSGEAAAAVPAGTMTAAPRKLFVREYDLGQLLREYPLTAEEIKMIFGFLWPKNKVKRRMQKVLRRGPRMQKKLGEVVYKGHYSYNLMLELQLGIRYSVGRSLRPRSIEKHSLIAQLGVLRPWWSTSSALNPSGMHSSGSGHKVQHVGCFSGLRHHHEEDQEQQQEQEQQQYCSHQQQIHQHVQQQLEAVLAGATGGGDLEEEDFNEELTVFFPSSGSSTTPAHPSSDYKWKDYCPRVFRRLRAAAQIDEADYMLSLAGSQALRQLNSPGKSGSMFLLSDDERFLVKTMRKSEMAVLLNMLPKYAAHMEKYPHSLITRFFGLHKVTPLHGRSVRFVVMANIFITDLQIHRRYDIKGSTDGRTVGPEGRAKAADGDPSIIFKDLDVDMRIVLEQSAHDALMEQLSADCGLLREVGVMDYSLLLGMHFPSHNLMTRVSLEPVASASLDGMSIPHASPLPGGLSAVPGSAGLSTQGSPPDSYFSFVTGQAGAAVMMHPRSTVSDDDTQLPPQQLQRPGAQQQLEAAVTSAGHSVAGSVGTPTIRSARQSLEQIPQHTATQFLNPSDEVQQPAAALQQHYISSGGGGHPAGFAGGTAGGAAGASAGGGSHHAHMLAAGLSSASAKNWNLYSGAAEQEETLAKVMERMRDMGFNEQMVKDVAELAKLKILGGKLKKRIQRKEPPSAVLLAMQQQRQEAENTVDGPSAHGIGQSSSPTATGHLVRHQTPTLSHLASLKGAFTGLGVPFEEDEEMVDTPMALGVPDPKAPNAGFTAAGSWNGMQLGINMPALAVPLGALSSDAAGVGDKGSAAVGGPVPEEVVLCFGIIDILQDYSTRKVLERAVKGVTHDKYSISVAPPKLYAKRFLEFTTKQVFMSQTEFTELRQQHAAEGSSLGQQPLSVDFTSAVQQQPPWALPPIATSAVRAAPPVAAPAAADEQYQDTVGGSSNKGLPLATEDSFPYPPGQLDSAEEEPAASSVVGLEEELPAASPFAVAPNHAIEELAVMDPPLLDLLAAPIGLDLTSPVADAAFSGSDSAGRLVSAEQVSVTVLEDGVIGGVTQQSIKPVQEAVLVPAIVIEKVPSLKQLSLVQQPSDSKVTGKGAGVQQQRQGSPGVILARG